MDGPAEQRHTSPSTVHSYTKTEWTNVEETYSMGPLIAQVVDYITRNGVGIWYDTLEILWHTPASPRGGHAT